MASLRARQAYIKALGIDYRVLREAPYATQPAEIPLSQAPKDIGQSSTESPPQALDWTSLQQQVVACTRCELHRSRTQTVFGVGNRQAEWLVIGEAPGADEDARGEPFVGRAGQL